MILNANALNIPLAAKSINCCVTSPPYFGLRDYGVDGQLGLEQSPDEYVAKMVQVFREVWRVLRDDGTLWLNLGDSYASNGMKSGKINNTSSTLDGGKRTQSAAASVSGKFIYDTKPKNLIGIPWRVAFALQADGWYLRSDIIWHKPNPMPESVTDRPTKSHEYIFLLSKSARYYYDAEAIKADAKHKEDQRAGFGRLHYRGKRQGDAGSGQENFVKIVDKRNKRSVWTVSTSPYKGAHFATFPPKLIEPCILAGCPEGGTVLDPFFGSGTTGQVAIKHNRQFVGLELNPEYIKLAKRRTSNIEVMLF